MSRVILPAKYVAETIQVQVDFLSQLNPGVSISAVGVTTCTVYSGVDASPGNVISGVATFSGTVLSQKLTGGVAGCVYVIVFGVTTSASETIKINGFLTVTPAQP